MMLIPSTRRPPSAWPQHRRRLASLIIALGAFVAAVSTSEPSTAGAADAETDAAITIVLSVTPAPPWLGYRFVGTVGHFHLSIDKPVSERFTVAPGRYRIEQARYPLWQLDSVSCVATDGLPVDMTTNLDGKDHLRIVLIAGQDVTCTFSTVRRPSITTATFDDINGNGRVDDSDRRLGNSSVTVRDSEGRLLSTRKSNYAGLARFIVPEGNYTVCHVMAADRVATNPPTDPYFGLPCRNVEVGASDKAWVRFLSTSRT